MSLEAIVNKTILDVKPYIPGKPIEEVKRQLKLKEVIKLASNETPFGPSPKVMKAISRQLPKLNRYPESDCYDLRKALAKRLKVSDDQLIFGNGSDEVIVMVVRAFVSAGDEVVIAKPSFLIYELASKIAGATIHAVPLLDFRYNLTAMKAAVTDKTKVIFIGNPDNPAGTFVTHDQLVYFMRGLRKDIVVFVDEAYFEYVSSKDYPRSIELLKEFENLIVTRTFSKMYGLAGLRIGYGVANKEMISFLNRVREPFNVNSLAQAAALACLEDKTYYQKVAREIKKQKEYLYKKIKGLGVTCKESVTNFILIDLKKEAKPVSDGLMKKGVIVRDMGPWGLKSFIRVTIGTEKENNKFIQALKEVL